MFKKTVKYENFLGEEKTKDFYFHLTKSELLELTSSTNGMEQRVKRMIETKDQVAILQEMRAIVNLAIGVRSEDGETFLKNDTIRAQLMFSPAYDELLMELLTDDNAAAEFIQQMLPKDMRDKVQKQLASQSPNPFKEPEDTRPAWEKEHRKPTSAELRTMTPDQLREAFSKHFGSDK